MTTVSRRLRAIEAATIPEPFHTVRARIVIRSDESASVIIGGASCREYPPRSGYRVEIDHAGAALITLRTDDENAETVDELLDAALDFVQRVPA